MKKLILCFLYAGFLCSTLIVKAQNLALGFKGGFSIPNLTAGGSNQNPLNTGYSSRLGADAAIFVEFKVSDHFSVQPMIEYSSQGGKKNGLQAITVPDQVAAMFPPGQAPTYLYANYNSEAKLDYILVPILAKFGWNLRKESPFRIYADVGPFFGYLIAAKQVTSGNDNLYTDAAGTMPLPIGPQSFDNTENIRSQLHKANVGVEGNIGLNYNFGVSNIFIEGGGNYGFLNIQKGTQNGKNNTGAATASIGYSYSFK